ncbi:hypothetical protein JCM8547_000313 [Rhodosporidiobolus lusitaniae]
MFLFSRSNKVDCFYCNTPLHLLPTTPTSGPNEGKQREVEGPVAVGSRGNFWCSVCGQITRRDKNGEVISDDPSFYDSSLNHDSFVKRASTSRAHLPPAFPTPSSTPFCRTCLSNQALQLHLLASYPSPSSSDSEDDSHPSHPSSSSSDPFPPLEEYRLSLDSRYPLVCASCAPAVEGTIRERDYRVKAQALGWRLRESEKRREREERMSEKARKRAGRRWVVEGVVWRARGMLWMATGIVTVGWCCAALVHPDNPSTFLPAFLADKAHLAMPLSLVSLLWAFWDPTWDRSRNERARGRQVHVQGRTAYLALQMLTYLTRVLAAVLLRFKLISAARSTRQLAFFLLLSSLLAVLSPLFPLPCLSYPPPIRLAPSPSSASPLTIPLPSDPLEPLAHLSLSRAGSLLTPPGTPGLGGSLSNSGSVSGAGMPRKRGGGGRNGGGRAAGGGLGEIRPRIPSFSLGSIPWGRDLAPDLGGGGAMDVDASSPPFFPSSDYGEEDSFMANDEDEDEAKENSMDWTPLPPLSPPTSTTSYRASPLSTAAGGNRGGSVSFARQRFVPPDLRKPTGLEGMFELVGLREEQQGGQADERMDVDGKREEKRGWLSGLWGR